MTATPLGKDQGELVLVNIYHPLGAPGLIPVLHPPRSPGVLGTTPNPVHRVNVLGPRWCRVGYSASGWPAFRAIPLPPYHVTSGCQGSSGFPFSPRAPPSALGQTTPFLPHLPHHIRSHRRTPRVPYPLSRLLGAADKSMPAHGGQASSSSQPGHQ